MQKFSKKTRKLIIFSPFIVLVVLFFIEAYATIRYENYAEEKIIKTHEKDYLKKVETSLTNRSETILKSIDFTSKPYYVDTQKIDEENIFIYLLQDDIVSPIYESNPKYIIKNIHKLNSNLQQIKQKEKFFSVSVHKSNRVHYEIFRYIPTKNIVIHTFFENDSYSSMYEKHTRLIFSDLNSKRINILYFEFILSSIFAFLVSYLFQKADLDFDKTEVELSKINENLRLANKSLEKQLLEDSLTKLPNDRLLLNDLTLHKEPKVIIVDIDNLKNIKEFCDDESANAIVLFLAIVLNRFCDKYCEFKLKLYYANNGQFVLLEDAPFNLQRYEMLATKLSKRLKGARVKTKSGNKFIEFTCTISFSLESKNTYETAIIALRRARQKSKDFLCYFHNINENEECKRHMQQANFIKIAIERDKIVPYYQPIFDRNGNITKHECLVRIINSEQRAVSPWEFLDASRQLKKYSQIERILIKKSIESISGTNKHISINFSLKDMTDGEVSTFFMEQIAKHNVANQIILEILEDEHVMNSTRVESFIKKAKSIGVRIAIDDFGSGYSNFSYMLSLQPDFIKVDGTLIKNIDKDEKSQAIASAILHFAKKLNIPTIAEFVHSKEVYETCLKFGFDEFQGFYLGEPHEKMLQGD